MEGLFNFLSPEAGQRRTKWLNDAINDNLSYFLGPTGIDSRLSGVAEMNPVNDIYRAGGDMRDGDYVGAAVNTATAAAPLAATPFMKGGGRAAAETLEDVLTGVSVGARGAGDWGSNFARMEDGMFAGPSAMTADLGAMKRAEEMLKDGVSRDEVWRDTGWFRGVDGKMRFEIDDSGIDLRPMGESRADAEAMNAEARDILSGIKERNAALKEQPDLFPADLRRANGDARRKAEALKYEARSNYGPEWHHSTNGQRAQYAFSGPLQDSYPEIMRDTIVRSDGYSQAYNGSYNGQRNTLDINRIAQEPRSVALHELQHMIQDAEGFARGSNLAEGERIARERVSSASIQRYNKMKEAVDALPLEEKEAFLRFEQDPDAPFAKEAFAQMSQRTRKIARDWDASSRLASSGGNISDANAMAFYKRHAGEVEARNVQARKDMSMSERRATPPWVTQDTPDNAQLIRYGNTTQANALNPAQEQAQTVLDLLRAGNADQVTDDMMAAADDLYLFDNYDLPMDAMHRHYRASKMGYDIEPLGARAGAETLYHQTPADIMGFKLGQNGEGPTKGHSGGGAIWASEIPHNIPAAHNTIDDVTGEFSEGVNIMPIVTKQAKRVGIDQKWDASYGLNDQFPRVVTMAENDRLTSEGFTHGTAGTEVAILDPTNIRSRFARFDPRLAHLRNLSAGVGGISAYTAMTAEEKNKEKVRKYLKGGT